MFDGSFKSSRKVSLRGRQLGARGGAASALTASTAATGSASSKQELLRQSKQAREERLALRLRTAASTRIQALLRRVLATRQLRLRVRQDLEAELAALLSPASAVDIRQQALPPQHLQTLLRQLLFLVTHAGTSSDALMAQKRREEESTAIARMQEYVVFMVLVSVLKGDPSPAQPTNMLAMPKDAVWIRQITQLVGIALRVVVTTVVRMPPAERSVNPYVLLLDALTVPERYQHVAYSIASDDGARDPAAAASLFCCALVERVATTTAFGPFEAVQQLITDAIERKDDANRESPHDGDVVALMVTKMAAQGLQTSFDQPEHVNGTVMQRFTNTVLQTPAAASSPLLSAITTRLEQQQVPHSTSVSRNTLFWTNAIRHMSVNIGSSSIYEVAALTTASAWVQHAVKVGNILDLLVQTGFPSILVSYGAHVLSQLASATHMEWAFDTDRESQSALKKDAVLDDEAVENGSLDDNDDAFMLGNDDHDDAASKAMAAVSAVTAALAVNPEQRDAARRGLSTLGERAVAEVRLQWQKLVDPHFTRSALSALRSRDAEASAMANLCNVYTTLLLALARAHVLSVRQSFRPPPAAVFTLLSAMSMEQQANEDIDMSGGSDVAHAPSIIRYMWEQIVSIMSVNAAGIIDATPDAKRKQQYTAVQPLLLVFNVIYSHLLLALDDESFYDRQWPFQPKEVAGIASFLKQFIYDTCWSNVNVNSLNGQQYQQQHPALLLFPTLTSAVKLFNQLYDRDCRRRFMADDGWLWPAMPPIRETVDLASMEGEELYDLQALALLVNGTTLNLSPQSRASRILTTIPQVFSFEDRVQLFQRLLEDEKMQLVTVRDEFTRAIQVRIKRDEIVEESFAFFYKTCETQSPAILKSRIKVTFINEQGLEEAGIDGGGVFKEYVDSLTKNAFSPEYGFFLPTNEQLLYPNPAARMLVDTPREVSDRYRFLGRVLGKAVYENILVEPQFAGFFLNKLLGKFNYIDDLHSLDPEMYRSLVHLKQYRGNVEDLALTFSVTETAWGQPVTRNLIPDGANIAVTNENRIRYIHLLANYKLNVLSSGECAAFLRGFRDLIPAKWIQMFSPSELQMLIGGTANKIDVQDWQKYTSYGGGYHPSQRVIQWFWELVENEFEPEDRAALLKFITSCSRQPLLGFSQLAPAICIHQVRVEDDDRLPSSATCMNLLKLPTYSSKEIMKRKLLYAIRANAGFDLS